MVNIPGDNDENITIFPSGKTPDFSGVISGIITNTIIAQNIANDDEKPVDVRKITELGIKILNTNSEEMNKDELFSLFGDLLHYGMQKYSVDLNFDAHKKYDSITAACYLDNASIVLEDRNLQESQEYKMLTVWKQVMAEFIGAPDIETISFERIARVIDNAYNQKRATV